MSSASLTSIIVDDDESARANLYSLLNRYCKDVEVLGLAASVGEALNLVVSKKPQVIFLDIRMPGGDGFSLLQMIPPEIPLPRIVLVTAYDQYAIKAIRARASDYLLKPIDVDELQQCVRQLITTNHEQQPVTSPDIAGERISINHAKGMRLITLRDIIYLEGDKNYTILYLASSGGVEKFVSSRTLGDFETALPEASFFRVHKSYIINIAHITEQRNQAGNYVIMKNGKQIEISRRRASLFRQFIHEHYSKQTKK